MMLGIVCVFAFFISTFAENSAIVDKFAIVIDAGSTGNRAFTFRISANENGDSEVKSIFKITNEPGISSYTDNPKEVVTLFEPLIDACLDNVPIEMQDQVAVYVKASAGMRLLTDNEQDALWNNLVDSCAKKYSFPVSKENFNTIDGHQEAYYAVLASNYVTGRINSKLQPREGAKLVGALDMGGSSTQMIFHMGTDVGKSLSQDSFWSHSWLSFGVETVRQRVWDHIIQNTASSATLGLDGSVSTTESIDKVIYNPCAFRYFEEEHIVSIPGGNVTVTVVGTGQAVECVELMKHIVWHKRRTEHTPHRKAWSQSEGTIDHPLNVLDHPEQASACEWGRPCPFDLQHVDSPKSQPPEEFYGMSVYFFAFDCIRHFSPNLLPSWPKPSVDELESAAHSFCSADWSTVETSMLGDHAYTNSLDAFAKRCFQTLYMSTLLRYGFGFDGSYNGVELALLVNGKDLEWSLGFLLSNENANA